MGPTIGRKGIVGKFPSLGMPPLSVKSYGTKETKSSFSRTTCRVSNPGLQTRQNCFTLCGPSWDIDGFGCLLSGIVSVEMGFELKRHHCKFQDPGRSRLLLRNALYHLSASIQKTTTDV
eukprot:3574655-Amphidinium_carterae.1